MNPRTCPLATSELKIYPDAGALANATAMELIRCGLEAIAQRGRFDLALAGGSTPREVYRVLAADHGDALAWDKVHLFFGDERTVPPDDPDSNFRMVRESLLENPKIAAILHRMEGELDPAIAADRYEAEVRQHFGVTAPVQPRFDLVLLGMGTDGHTASLFPGTTALEEKSRAVAANAVPQLNTQRITLTFPAINQARQILFLTAGADKTSMLAKVLRGDPGGGTYPAQEIRPVEGRLVWMTDEAAAGQNFS